MNNSETIIKKENKLKKLVKGFFSKCRRHKIITAFILIVIAVMIVAAYNVKNNIEQLQQAEYSFIRTTTLAKDGLETAVNVTGSVESAETSTVSYSVGMNTSAPKIKTVNVTVGDYVEEGDVIVVLDNTDILEKITEQQELLSEKSTELYEKYTAAVEACEDAKNTYTASDTAKTKAYNAMVNAEKVFTGAKNSIAAFQADYDSAVKAEDEAGARYNEAYSTLIKAQADAQAAYDNAVSVKTEKIDALTAADTALEAATTAYNNAVDEGITALTEFEKAITDAETAKTTAEKALEEATENVDTASSALETAKQNTENFKKSSTEESNYTAKKDETKIALSRLNTAKDAANYAEYESEYNSAVAAYNSATTAKEQSASRVDSAEEAVELAYENYENSQTSDTLEDLREQLENCNLRAETSGKVTALSAVVGNTVNGTVATIQDTESLKIAVTIGEADINTVEIGMKCKIRSDATEGYISGTLTQIDPVSSMGGSFGAEVTVNGGAQGLLIGMNADVDIIISEVADCFTVPADAIGEDEQGKFIYRHTSGAGVDMEFEKVYVTVGESNDYYVEISSDELAEGDVIRSYSDLTIGIETVSGEDAAQMQGFGNMFGDMDGMSFGDALGGNGEMPSMPDGGNFPSGGGNGERPQMPSGGGFSGGNGGGVP